MVLSASVCSCVSFMCVWKSCYKMSSRTFLLVCIKIASTNKIFNEKLNGVRTHANTLALGINRYVHEWWRMVCTVHGKQRALCIPVIVFIVQFILLFLYSSNACYTIIVIVPTIIIITIMVVFVAISVPLSFACTFTHHLWCDLPDCSFAKTV